jgi:hypothetical protein
LRGHRETGEVLEVLEVLEEGEHLEHAREDESPPAADPPDGGSPGTKTRQGGA